MMSIHILSPKLYHNFPRFFVPKFFPFWRPQVRIKSVSKMAHIFPFFKTKIFPVSDTLFIPVSDTLLSPFPIPFLSLFPIPFLSPFWIPVYPCVCSYPFQDHFYPSPNCYHAFMYSVLFPSSEYHTIMIN